MAEFRTTTDDGICTLAVAGEVDIAEVDQLLTAGREGIEGGCRTLRIDLAEVTFIDSSGLGALVRLRNEAGKAGGAVELAGVPDPVARLLEISGLSQVFGPGPGTSS